MFCIESIKLVSIRKNCIDDYIFIIYDTDVPDLDATIALLVEIRYYGIYGSDELGNFRAILIEDNSWSVGTLITECVWRPKSEPIGRNVRNELEQIIKKFIETGEVPTNKVNFGA